MHPIRAYLLAALALVAALADATAVAQTPITGSMQRTGDALAAVEANRPKIVARMVDAHGEAMLAHGVSLDAFRAALWQLPPERLLAASLADSPEEVNAIVGLSLSKGPAGLEPKDGAGSGPNSWIGYTAGNNVASGTGSAVAAGTFNVASGQNAFIGAGTFNGAKAANALVGGGNSNYALGISSLVLGGFDNQATAIDAAVVAGAGSRATGARSVVVGGGYNLASGQWSFIGGGGRQTGSGVAGTNPEDNVASGDFATIAGGKGNRASARAAAVGGGSGNLASGTESTVSGGGNLGGACSTAGVSRACTNSATDGGATVAGGYGNLASGYSSSVGGGFLNTAAALGATVPGGIGNNASGLYSFAAGKFAHADASACALFGLWSSSTAFNCLGVGNILRIGGDHGFSVEYHSQRTDGGGTRWVHIGNVLAGQTIGTWNGAYLTDAGVWVNASSSKAGKTGFAPVDVRDVLKRVADLPITTWRYKTGEGDVRHMGPMAEDFWTAFNVGYGAHTIADLDARGVALAAIQGLKRELDDRDARIDQLTRRLDAMDALQHRLDETDALKRRLDAVESLLRDVRSRH
jgi:hypothetical protein